MHTAAVIRFARPLNRLEETSSSVDFSHVPITRTGYPNSTVTVSCLVKAAPNFGNATAGFSLTDEGRDFITTLQPSRVTFEPGDLTKSNDMLCFVHFQSIMLTLNSAGCSLYVFNDIQWEGPESLTMELQLGSGSFGVELPEETSSTIVIIDDPEDSEYHTYRHMQILILTLCTFPCQFLQCSSVATAPKRWSHYQTLILTGLL